MCYIHGPSASVPAVNIWESDGIEDNILNGMQAYKQCSGTLGNNWHYTGSGNDDGITRIESLLKIWPRQFDMLQLHSEMTCPVWQLECVHCPDNMLLHLSSTVVFLM